MAIFKKILSIFLRISISIALLIFLLRQVDKKSLVEVISHADKRMLGFAFLVSFFNYLLCLFRWQMLLKAAEIHLPLKRIIISFSGGLFFSLFLPSTIGGDVVRSLDLSLHTRRPREVIATVFLDRLSGYFALGLVSLLALLAGWRFIRDNSVLIAVIIINGFLVLLLLILFNKFIYAKVNKLLRSPTAGKIREAITNLHQEMHIFRHRKNTLLNNIAISILIQVIGPTIFYLTALALGLKIKIIYFLIFIPIIGAISLLPISIGGLGLRDASAVYFFAKIGVEKNLALALSLLNFFFILIYGILGGLIYVLTIHHRRIQHHQPPAI
jgi:hypothetical protein